MILDQDMFHCIRPLEHFEDDRKNTPTAVRLPSGWVLSDPLPSTLGLLLTFFTVVTQKETDSQLDEQIRSWWDIESYGAYKQVNPRSSADSRAQNIL